MESFQALLIDGDKTGDQSEIAYLHPDQLVAESPWLLIENHYSSIGYKDALAASGRGKILRKSPLIGGQDGAGVVVESEDPSFPMGTEVVLTGYGLGEAHHGGLSQLMKVPSEWATKIPEGLSLYESMALGTAGFTAAQAIVAMEINHQRPDQGPILVTGATGGVGSLAIQMLSQKKYEVWAVTGRPAYHDFLKNLGATKICSFDDLALHPKALGKGLFGGVIDNLGGNFLESVLPYVKPFGNIAVIGLAQGVKLQTTVMPFIIRGVNLLGINSTYCPKEIRNQIWNRLGADLKPKKLKETVTKTVPLEEVKDHVDQLLDRKYHGRIVVSCYSNKD